MKLTFSSNKLERQLTRDKDMRKAFREDWSKKIRLRVKELQVAINLEDLKSGPGRWHPLRGNRFGQWAGDVSGNYRIIVTPADDGMAAEITAVRIEEIKDYHEG